VIWSVVHRFEARAAAIADRHYNRRKPGSPQFVPPGSCLVLLAPSAVWVTSAPLAEYVRHRWPGAWVNSLFRREGGDVRASELIRQAIAATRWKYGDPPALGMVTFVDASKVIRKRDPGRCYVKAGFRRVGFTGGGLVALQMLPEDMPEAESPVGEGQIAIAL
jgi:hypothetical protein